MPEELCQVSPKSHYVSLASHSDPNPSDTMAQTPPWVPGWVPPESLSFEGKQKLDGFVLMWQLFLCFFEAYQMEIKDNGENDFLCVFSFFLLIPPLRHYDRVLILESATTLYRDIRQIIPLVNRT